MHLDAESCYRAVKSRDRRFDGVFFIAVRTTGIYCRPSCPARTPAYENVTFHPTSAAAQAAGYRACKRCLPDATPGSPDWDVAADVAGRAMRLIADGVVDRDGVEGLAARIGYTSRHLTRILTQELGAGPLALARAKRAQTARVLLETTELDARRRRVRGRLQQRAPVQRHGPRGLRVDADRAARPAWPRCDRGHDPAAPGGPDAVRRRAPCWASWRPARCPASSASTGTTYARTLRLPHGTGTVALELTDQSEAGTTAFVPATFRLDDLRDLSAAVERVRRLLDADCDPVAVADAFAGDPVLGVLTRAAPGLRVPGHVDGDELAVRAVLGQQVTVAAARTAAARLTLAHGTPLPAGRAGRSALPASPTSSRPPTAWPSSTRSRSRCHAPGAVPW